MLTDIEKSLDVVETEARGSVEAAVDEFLRVIEVDAKQLDSVIAAVGDPDAVQLVDDDGPWLAQLIGPGARRGAVNMRHLLALSVDETDTVKGAAGAPCTTVTHRLYMIERPKPHAATCYSSWRHVHKCPLRYTSMLSTFCQHHSQLLYALKILRAYGLCERPIHRGEGTGGGCGI